MAGAVHLGEEARQVGHGDRGARAGLAHDVVAADVDVLLEICRGGDRREPVALDGESQNGDSRIVLGHEVSSFRRRTRARRRRARPGRQCECNTMVSSFLNGRACARGRSGPPSSCRNRPDRAAGPRVRPAGSTASSMAGRRDAVGRRRHSRSMTSTSSCARIDPRGRAWPPSARQDRAILSVICRVSRPTLMPMTGTSLGDAAEADQQTRLRAAAAGRSAPRCRCLAKRGRLLHEFRRTGDIAQRAGRRRSADRDDERLAAARANALGHSSSSSVQSMSLPTMCIFAPSRRSSMMLPVRSYSGWSEASVTRQDQLASETEARGRGGASAGNGWIGAARR